MPRSYSNYLANTTFKTTSFGNVTGLGTSARTAAAVLLGGPRAGAGSSYRIYSYLANRDPATLNADIAKLQALLKAQAYNYNSYSRNLAFNLG
jgi:hypothetical protein